MEDPSMGGEKAERGQRGGHTSSNERVKRESLSFAFLSGYREENAGFHLELVCHYWKVRFEAQESDG